MASNTFLSEEDFSCPVCTDIFKDPVLLPCSHSFCKACLQEWWRKKEKKECPVCKKRSSMEPPLNLALKNLCETFVQEKHRRASTGPGVLCSEHADEKLKLFCLECQQPVCLVCRDSKIHANHMFRPIKEAASERKEEVQKSLKPLQDKLEVFNEFKTKYDQTAEHIKARARHTEAQMKEQFKKMHQFLHDEEEARITALREEEEQKSQMMKEKIKGLNKDISTISDTVGAIVEELRAQDISFLQNYRTTVEKVQLTLKDPQPVSGALIDEAKHLGNLAFKVWDKMKDIVSYTPVILDPNTAHQELILSDELTSVRCGPVQQLPDNTERFDKHLSVGGSEGFNCGTHSWDVEVGDNTSWWLGVSSESYWDKRNRLKLGRHWGIYYDGGKYHEGYPGFLKFENELLSLKQNPKKIRVQLERNNRTLSFCDPDTNTHIHTFTLWSFLHIGSKTLFPYIGTSHTVPLKILPCKVSVTLEPHR